MATVKLAIAAEHDMGISDKPVHVIFAHRSSEHALLLFPGRNLGFGRFDHSHIGFRGGNLPRSRNLVKRFSSHSRFWFVE